MKQKQQQKRAIMNKNHKIFYENSYYQSLEADFEKIRHRYYLVSKTK